MVARLQGEDSEALKEYVNSELITREKQELQIALEFFIQKCTTIAEKESIR